MQKEIYDLHGGNVEQALANKEAQAVVYFKNAQGIVESAEKLVYISPEGFKIQGVDRLLSEEIPNPEGIYITQTGAGTQHANYIKAQIEATQPISAYTFTLGE